jgi:hypothetical protein
MIRPNAEEAKAQCRFLVHPTMEVAAARELNDFGVCWWAHNCRNIELMSKVGFKMVWEEFQEKMFLGRKSS